MLLQLSDQTNNVCILSKNFLQNQTFRVNIVFMAWQVLHNNESLNNVRVTLKLKQEDDILKMKVCHHITWMKRQQIIANLNEFSDKYSQNQFLHMSSFLIFIIVVILCTYHCHYFPFQYFRKTHYSWFFRKKILIFSWSNNNTIVIWFNCTKQ